MSRLISAAKAFLLGREAGTALVEYAVLLVLIAAVTIAAMSAFWAAFGDVFRSLAGSL
jgi:Flp pilus assembly pilin Flp